MNKINLPLYIIFISLCQLFAADFIYGKSTKAPNFALMSTNGNFVFKSKLKGNLLISFWATYCAPCLKEMPHLIELEKKYAKIKNFSLILINTDPGSSGKSKALKIMEKIGIKHEFLLDPYQITISKYNPQKILPATFLVNKKGKIIFHLIGATEDSLKQLESKIRKIR